MHQAGCAANAGIHLDGVGRAIHRAGTAFHAGIEVYNLRPIFGKSKNLVWTNLYAPAATDARVWLQPQGRRVSQIPVPFHFASLIPLQQPTAQEQQPAKQNGASHDRKSKPHFLFHSGTGCKGSAACEVERVECTYRRERKECSHD